MAEMEELKRYLVEMKAEMIANGVKLNGINEDVSLLKTTIIGLPETQRPGLVHDIKDIKTRIDNHDIEIKEIKDGHFKEKVIVGTGAATAGALAGAVTQTSWVKALATGFISLFK